MTHHQFLMPHAAQPKFRGCPRVYFTPQVWADQSAFVDIASGEVGWMGTVLMLPGGGLMVDNVYMLEQGVHGATTEIDPEAMYKLVEQLMAEDAEAGIQMGDPMSKLSRLRFWGHSHATMGTGPSDQDNKQLASFGKEGAEWYIRAICNKHGKCSLDLALFGTIPILIEDLPWSVQPNPLDKDDPATLRYAEIEKEMAEKVRQIGYTAGKGWNGYTGYEGYGRHSQYIGSRVTTSQGTTIKGGGKAKAKGKVKGGKQLATVK